MMEGAVKVQSAYKKRVALGLSPGDRPSEDGLLAVERMMASWATFRYRVVHYDKAFLARAFESLTHDVFTFKPQVPTLAACTLFSLDKERVQDDIVRVALNILPRNDNETVVVFSYTRRDAPLARSALSRALNSDGEYQKYEISKMLLNYCENFVISPAYFENWTERKRAVVRDYYTRTVFTKDLEFEDSDLTLF
jgi:hypothetical protein